MSKKIYLIDGNSFIYRMFFAIPEFSTKEGRVVNATFGMAKFLTQQMTKESPDYVVFIKDAKWDNFRHKLYSEYKATRDRMPDTLRSQIGDIEEMISAMGMDIIEIPGYEADDVIGTLAVRLSQKSQNEIYILSGDKDLYALINEQVKVYDTQRKKISGPEETFEKFWVPAECVRDYLAICGDSSDNIPGIAGIWPKKAQVLLNHFETLEKIYEAIDNIDKEYEIFPEDVQKLFKGKTLEKFILGRELAFLSQKLATLDCDMELNDFELDDYEFVPTSIQTPELHDFFRELEFFSLLSQEEVKKESWEDTRKKVQIIWDTEWLENLEKQIYIRKDTTITLDTETTNLDVRKAKLVGISILLDEDTIFYINFLHVWPQIERTLLQSFVLKLLESNITIIWHNLKYDLQILELFLKSSDDESKLINQENDFWQMSIGL